MEDKKQKWIYQTIAIDEDDIDMYISYIKKGYCLFDIKDYLMHSFCEDFEHLYEKNKDNDFLYEHALLLRKIGNKNKGEDIKHFQIMLNLANQGYVKAYYSLGLCYADGYGTEQDLKKAYEYLLLGASNGYLLAYNALGVMYYSGEYVKEDKAKSFEIMLECAERGLAVSQVNVALAYYYGTSTSKDYQKAFHYASLAASQGHKRALYLLGNMYLDGDGVEEDYDEALYYFMKALEKGYERARDMLDYLKDRSTLLYQNKLWYKIDGRS